MYFTDRHADYELIQRIRLYFETNPDEKHVEIPRLVAGVDPDLLTQIWPLEVLKTHPLILTREHIDNMTDREAVNFLSLNGSYIMQ